MSSMFPPDKPDRPPGPPVWDQRVRDHEREARKMMRTARRIIWLIVFAWLLIIGVAAAVILVVINAVL